MILKSEDPNNDEKELNPTWMIIQITFVFVSICALILRSFYTICWEEKQVIIRLSPTFKNILSPICWGLYLGGKNISISVDLMIVRNYFVNDMQYLGIVIDVFVTKICHQHWSKIFQKKIQKKLSRLESARSTRVELDEITDEEVFLQPKRVKFDHKSTRNKKVKLDKS